MCCEFNTCWSPWVRKGEQCLGPEAPLSLSIQSLELRREPEAVVPPPCLNYSWLFLEIQQQAVCRCGPTLHMGRLTRRASALNTCFLRRQASHPCDSLSFPITPLRWMSISSSWNNKAMWRALPALVLIMFPLTEWRFWVDTIRLSGNLSCHCGYEAWSQWTMVPRRWGWKQKMGARNLNEVPPCYSVLLSCNTNEDKRDCGGFLCLPKTTWITVRTLPWFPPGFWTQCDPGPH